MLVTCANGHVTKAPVLIGAIKVPHVCNKCLVGLPADKK